MVTKVKPNINSVEVQLSNNGHPVDGALVGASSLCLSDYGNWIGGCIKLQKGNQNRHQRSSLQNQKLTRRTGTQDFLE
jgi:hypothetical protein